MDTLSPGLDKLDTTTRQMPPAGPEHLHAIRGEAGLILPLKSSCEGCCAEAERCSKAPALITHEVA
jgi:hypothetical protein